MKKFLIMLALALVPPLFLTGIGPGPFIAVIAKKATRISLPGTSGNYISCPDNAINSPTGDFTWVAQVYHDNASSSTREGYITKENATYDNFRFFKFHQAPYTRISFLNSEPGVGNNSFNNQWTGSAFSPGNGAWFWVKVEFDADVGGGNQQAYLYWRQTEGDSWIDVSGSDGAQGGTGSDDFSAPLELGRVESTGETLDGGIRVARQYTGMGDTGTPDWEFDARKMGVGQTTYLDHYSGLTFTINQSGSPQAEAVR